MTFKTLLLSFEPTAAIVTLNRPEKRNAISLELIEDLLRALDACERSAARAVILTGAGKAFCSGMDLEMLKAISTQSHDENLADSRKMAGLFRRLYEFPRPVIAAVNGPAIAGGCGMVSVCDLALAVPEAKFGYTEARVGFIPALVSVYLVRMVGERVARELLLAGRIYDAAEALRLGLVNEIVSADKLMARARELVEIFAESSPASLLAAKRLMTSMPLSDLNAALEQAVEENARIRTTADFREGLSSFLEKRKPKWSP